MPEARFSIIITCYNQQAFIRQAVDSALAQGPDVLEVIVVDDASTDDSLSILKSYGQAIRLLSFSANQGCIKARNEGASRARGEYIVFLDGDDILAPWTMRIYERLISERRPKIVIANPFTFTGPAPVAEDAPGEIAFVEFDRLIDKDRPRPIFPSFALERKMFEDVGRWTPGIFHLDLDDIAMKMAGVGPTIMVCAPYTFYYRVHEGNSVHNVRPFLTMLRHIIGKTKAGQYPGTAALRFPRYAWLGIVVRYWATRALQEGFYIEFLKLAAAGWTPVLCTLLDRWFRPKKERVPTETMTLETGSANREERAHADAAREATMTLLEK